LRHQIQKSVHFNKFFSVPEIRDLVSQHNHDSTVSRRPTAHGRLSSGSRFRANLAGPRGSDKGLGALEMLLRGGLGFCDVGEGCDDGGRMAPGMGEVVLAFMKDGLDWRAGGGCVVARQRALHTPTTHSIQPCNEDQSSYLLS